MSELLLLAVQCEHKRVREVELLQFILKKALFLNWWEECPVSKKEVWEWKMGQA